MVQYLYKGMDTMTRELHTWTSLVCYTSRINHAHVHGLIELT